ncbi:glycosyltransferase [Streptomyces sp. NBC_00191]|uniref:glycosyltransferase family 2 protein n=1 Tax=Streptomyces sp. NBC_00191 TaxID=2975674 RepID=UPI00325211D2
MDSTAHRPHLAELQVTELDLDGPDGAVLSFGPALPGGTPVRGGTVYTLVRLRGRPVATVVCRIPPGKAPADAVAATARAALAGREPPGRPGPVRSIRPDQGAGSGACDRRPEDGGPPAEGRGESRRGASATDATRHGGTSRARRATGECVPGHASPARSAGQDLAPGGRRTPRTSVVVATRERAGQLTRALDSLLAQDHPDFEIVVVDNAPATGATQDLVEHKYGERVRYVRESVPGLAIAHNRGVAVADGTVIAFTDDDVVADPHWLTALTVPFTADPGLGCTTGLILPARLRTPAQILLESHGGFAKGFEPREYDPAHPPAGEPLFPFTAGSFGSGANMAFRSAALREIGGFDPATGTGTPARGGDDLYAFVSVLAAGHRLRYTPDALVWHHHRETWQDLQNQAYGYGAGLTAYLTAVLARRPALLPALLRKLPRGLAHARTITAHRDAAGAAVPGDHGAQDYPWPRHLSRLERRGMLAGPIGYAKARLRVRGVPLPWDELLKPRVET